ncbi:MAG: transcriptional repressor [Bacteroidota bacterium]
MGVIRKTKSVSALLDAFSQQEIALSTLELVERFKDQMNRSTVYRILERLENEGVLHSFSGQDGITWYALCNDKDCSNTPKFDTHPHFQCRDCGKTECLPISVPIPEVSEHNVESVSLLMVGQCSDCAS